VFKKYSRLLLTLAFLILLFCIVELTGIRDKVSLEFIADNFNHHFVIGMLIFAALYSLGNLVQIPGFVFLGAAVVTLGKFEGAAVSYLAAITSCCITYWVIRIIGGDALRKLESPFAQKILAKLDSNPIKTIILLRTFFQTAPALNYSLALSGINFQKYALGTLLGLPLPVMLYCLFFSYIQSSIA
jgi:uncharacterized membrane protein YdjX (TVP38/TMEM64 family)